MIKKYENFNFNYVDILNYDFKSKKPEFKKFSNLESLYFSTQNIVKNKGKGAGELLSIDYALNNYVLFRNSKYIMKINGRYKLLNLKKIISKINFENENSIIYGEFRAYTHFLDPHNLYLSNLLNLGIFFWLVKFISALFALIFLFKKLRVVDCDYCYYLLIFPAILISPIGSSIFSINNVYFRTTWIALPFIFLVESYKKNIPYKV